MFSGSSDSLSTAVASAKEQDLGPLAAECAEALDLDRTQLATIESCLQTAWFFGVRTGHAVMVETKMGQTDPAPTVRGMQDEFQELMESCADALDATVGTTIAAWNYLGRAWIAGAKFWEVEIAARLIEYETGSFEDQLRKLWE
jgi:hypothetical protein